MLQKGGIDTEPGSAFYMVIKTFRIIRGVEDDQTIGKKYLFKVLSKGNTVGFFKFPDLLTFIKIIVTGCILWNKRY